MMKENIEHINILKNKYRIKSKNNTRIDKRSLIMVLMNVYFNLLLVNYLGKYIEKLIYSEEFENLLFYLYYSLS